MKRIILLFILIICATAGKAQKTAFGLNYQVDAPNLGVMPKMGINHSAGLFIGYKVLEHAPLWFSSDLSTGMYAYKSRKEVYTFSDGTQTETWVNYSSNMHKLLFGFNYDLGKRENLISGYLTAQGGYAIMNSKIYIEDPNDPGGCKALVNKNTFMYGGGIYAGGGGVRININKLTKNKYGFNHHIDIGVKYLGGGKFSYVNINHMQEHNHAIAGNAPKNGDTRDLNVKFVNVTTKDVHEHKVAEVYTSGFNMLNFKLGYLVSF